MYTYYNIVYTVYYVKYAGQLYDVCVDMDHDYHLSAFVEMMTMQWILI